MRQKGSVRGGGRERARNRPGGWRPGAQQRRPRNSQRPVARRGRARAHEAGGNRRPGGACAWPRRRARRRARPRRGAQGRERAARRHRGARGTQRALASHRATARPSPAVRETWRASREARGAPRSSTPRSRTEPNGRRRVTCDGRLCAAASPPCLRRRQRQRARGGGSPSPHAGGSPAPAPPRDSVARREEAHDDDAAARPGRVRRACQPQRSRQRAPDGARRPPPPPVDRIMRTGKARAPCRAVARTPGQVGDALAVR